ncbi:MAG: hypothetical protein AAF511_06135, partial [Pseudomonadota bacterium]
MSSPTTSRTLGSFIFARSLSIGLIAFVFLVAFSWCLEGITRARVTANLRSAITAQADNIETVFQNDGVGELIDGARRDGRAVWPEDWYYDAVIEREFLFRLIGIEDQTLAGFEDLDPPSGFATFDQIVDDGDRSIKVITLRFDLSDDHELIVGRSLPYQLRDIRNMAV